MDQFVKDVGEPDEGEVCCFVLAEDAMEYSPATAFWMVGGQGANRKDNVWVEYEWP